MRPVRVTLRVLRRLQAPVIDSCGSAGGRKPGQGNGGFGASFVNTTHAKVGDLGSKTLPVHDTGVIWKAGAEYEVAWTLQAVSAKAPAAVIRQTLRPQIVYADIDIRHT